MLVGYSKIGTSVIVEPVQHAGIVRAFSVPGGQIKLLSCGLLRAISAQADTMEKLSIYIKRGKHFI